MGYTIIDKSGFDIYACCEETTGPSFTMTIPWPNYNEVQPKINYTVVGYSFNNTSIRFSSTKNYETYKVNAFNFDLVGHFKQYNEDKLVDYYPIYNLYPYRQLISEP